MTDTRPEFDRPPLAEQAITVIFDRILGFSLVDFGLFWNHLQAEFPITTTQPMAEPALERFDSQASQQVFFKIMPGDTLPRAVFQSNAGHERIQIQADLFSFNWLKVGDAAYPRSEALVRRFVALFESFCEHLASRGLGEIKITHCELVNVNIIPVSDFGTGFGDADRFLKIPSFAVGLDGVELETNQINAQYLLRNAEGASFGRLRYSLTPVFRIEDGEKAYRFELTARGNPVGIDLKSALSFFGKGRDAINAAFMASTTEIAHAHWGLK